MQKKLRILRYVWLILFVTGCSALTAPTPPAQTGSGTASPQAGKTTVAGRIISTKDGKPLVNTPIRLAEVYRGGGQTGAFVLDGALSPGGTTDNTGSFTIANIESREYVLVVGDVYGKYTIVSGDDGKARVWKTEPGKTLDMGEIKVDPGS